MKMKPRLLPLFVLSCLFSCNSTQENSNVESEKIVFQPEDKAMVEKVLDLYSAEKDTPTSAVMVKVGSYLKETPYVAHTLETDEEQLVVNMREMDCTTFAENCLAISRTINNDEQTFEQFTYELQHIRYRNGIIDGYPSRLHYFSDWIYNNDQEQRIEDISREIAETPFPKKINFMSTHPDSYRQLKESAQLVRMIAEQEQEISAREMFFIPENRIAEVENKLMDGDIVGITTGMEGIAISHVGILIRNAGRIHLMHASSLAEKVVVSEKILEEYLLNSKSATGIMVARPL